MDRQTAPDRDWTPLGLKHGSAPEENARSSGGAKSKQPIHETDKTFLSHNISKINISHYLIHLQSIPEVDGSFSVVDLPRWVYKGLHALVSIFGCQSGGPKVARTESQNRS